MILKTKRPLILASGSPRRKELMHTLNLPFEVLISDVDESFEPGTIPEQLPGILAERKAEAVLKMNPEALVLAADTVVVMDHHILNKPMDLEEAKKMLQMLSGRMHSVYTAFSLGWEGGQKTIVDRADVYFKSLKESEIQFYLEHGKPLDKAGSYGIQEWIGLVAVERIEGSFFTVMGLPTHLVWKEIASEHLS